MSAKLISIIGPVGVGKTTLAQKLSAALPAKIIYEDYTNFTGEEIAIRVPIFSNLEVQLGRTEMLLIIDLSNSFASK